MQQEKAQQDTSQPNGVHHSSVKRRQKGKSGFQRPGALLAALACLVLAIIAASQFSKGHSWLSFGASPLSDTKQAQAFAPIGAGTCQLSGTVQDGNCDFSSVEVLNGRHLLPILSELSGMPFFRYFKVNLYCDCPFWPDDGMCSLRDCSVCECENEQIPKPLLAADGRLSPAECEGLSQLEEESTVDRRVDPTVAQNLQKIQGWRGLNNPWMPEEDLDLEFSYINLLENPERYTGYKGEHAHRIWNLLYSQQCFSEKDGFASCPEKRIFYRLISGLHTSISCHLVNEYLLDEASNKWGPNLPEFQQRLGNEGVKERVENLYFAYLFVLRAVMKAGSYLEGVRYFTGCRQDDARTLRLVQELVNNDALKAACPIPFDEGRMWKSEDNLLLRQQLQDSFRNMTKAMDCVGCEKCKLWGKLQLLGVATSLKILFTAESCSDAGSAPPGLDLERNEIIALVNLLERLSKSIEIVRDMSSQLVASDTTFDSFSGAVQDLTRHPLQQTL